MHFDSISDVAKLDSVTILSSNFSHDPSGQKLLAEVYYPGCQCIGVCSSNCSCSEQSYKHLSNIIDNNEHIPVFECNANCSCASECPNRILQHNATSLVDIFTTQEKGKGVRAISSINKGDFIVEYCGEIISVSESKRRLEEYDKQGLNYLLVIREYISKKETYIRTNIDATKKGSIARYINHSCDANSTPIIVRVNSRIPRVGLFANRNINKGEEITFDYGSMDQDKEWPLSKYSCHCGSTKCRKVLPFNPNI